jgi:lycopene beta-cyclase
VQVDVAVVGAGGAGGSILVHLARLLAPGREPPTVAVVDPERKTGRDRTWCFWDEGASAVDAAVHRAWGAAVVVDAGGGEHRLDLAPLRYVMVRSQDFYALADEAGARLGVRRVLAPADAVLDGEDFAQVRTPAGTIRARWVLDSRPAPPRLRANTALLQHFRGWTVRFPVDAFDPSAPVLMDFSVPQPGSRGEGAGVAFGYVLPEDARTGLVEYTEFSRSRLSDAEYDKALAAYLDARYGGAGGYEIGEVEDGAIPMTDAVHARRAGRRILRLGTAGGATRGSTGYTFAAMQRQAARVAADVLAARVPDPGPAYPARHRWMDAVLLRALDRGLVDGPELFTRMLLRNPPSRVLRFLDGRTSGAEELRVMASTPMATMLRASVVDAAARVERRLTGGMTMRMTGPLIRGMTR